MEDSQELVGEGPHGLRLEAEKHHYGAGPHVFQGVGIDQWHRPRGYRVLIQNPGGDSLRSSPVATAGFTTVTKRVPAEQMTHLAWRRRYPAPQHLPHHLAVTLPRTRPAPHRVMQNNSRRTGPGSDASATRARSAAGRTGVPGAMQARGARATTKAHGRPVRLATAAAEFVRSRRVGVEAQRFRAEESPGGGTQWTGGERGRDRVIA